MTTECTEYDKSNFKHQVGSIVCPVQYSDMLFCRWHRQNRIRGDINIIIFYCLNANEYNTILGSWVSRSTDDVLSIENKEIEYTATSLRVAAVVFVEEWTLQIFNECFMRETDMSPVFLCVYNLKKCISYL